MKKAKFLFVLVLFSFLMLPQIVFTEQYSSVMTLRDERIGTTVESELANGVPQSLIISGRIAVLENFDPWGYNAVEQILSAWYALDVDVIPSTDFGTVDLSGYQKVIISSRQSGDFYAALEGNRTWVESYVMLGGILEVNAATYSTEGEWILPFGLGLVWNATNNVEIADPTHPVLNNPSVIDGADLDGWSSSAHGYFNNTAEATVILTHDCGEPVLIEQRFGLGYMIATSQPVEWAYGHIGYTDFCENLVLYVPTTYVAPGATPSSPFAVIQDNDAWDWLGANATQEILVKYGIDYDIINSAMIGAIDLSGYEKVIISADQPTLFYSKLEANRTWLESYVLSGGVLEIHAATQGSNWVLPSGAIFNYTGVDDVVAVDPFHYTLYRPYWIAEPGLAGWYWSTHGYFTNVTGSSVILAYGDEPVLFEKNFGDGHIIASGQTLEYAWHMNLSYMLENIILYMPGMVSPAMGPRPSDRTVEFGTTGAALTWSPTDLRLVGYNVTRNGAIIGEDDWEGENIVASLNGLAVGTYTFVCKMWDALNRSIKDLVLVTVQDTTNPTFDEPLTDQTLQFGFDFTYNLNASDLSGIDHWWISNPGNFTISGTGVITNSIPLEVGVYQLEVRAYDPYDNYCTATFLVTVESIGILGIPTEIVVIVIGTIGVVVVLLYLLRRRAGSSG
ncbi:MAG: hypothetical protein EAX95_00685 [Candidatus Thorarchaeota archaeon]|nr:hypothetical protein [Candidatus Thorarchaeota archaeon]